MLRVLGIVALFSSALGRTQTVLAQDPAWQVAGDHELFESDSCSFTNALALFPGASATLSFTGSSLSLRGISGDIGGLARTTFMSDNVTTSTRSTFSTSFQCIDFLPLSNLDPTRTFRVTIESDVDTRAAAPASTQRIVLYAAVIEQPAEATGTAPSDVATATSSDKTAPSGSKANTAVVGAAIAVVLLVLALTAVGAWLFLRRRRRARQHVDLVSPEPEQRITEETLPPISPLTLPRGPSTRRGEEVSSSSGSSRTGTARGVSRHLTLASRSTDEADEMDVPPMYSPSNAPALPRNEKTAYVSASTSAGGSSRHPSP